MFVFTNMFVFTQSKDTAFCLSIKNLVAKHIGFEIKGTQRFSGQFIAETSPFMVSRDWSSSKRERWIFDHNVHWVKATKICQRE